MNTKGNCRSRRSCIEKEEIDPNIRKMAILTTGRMKVTMKTSMRMALNVSILSGASVAGIRKINNAHR